MSLEISNLKKSFQQGPETLIILNHLYMQVPDSGVVAVVGAKLPVKEAAKVAVVSKPKTTFSLSPSLLAEIEKGAAKDRKARKAKS